MWALGRGSGRSRLLSQKGVFDCGRSKLKKEHGYNLPEVGWPIRTKMKRAAHQWRLSAVEGGEEMNFFLSLGVRLPKKRTNRASP